MKTLLTEQLRCNRLLLMLLLCGCAAQRPLAPGGFASGSGPSIGRDQLSFIAEAFDDGQGTITKDWPISPTLQIDSIAGTISLHRLNGHCQGKDIASVGFLSSEAGNLITWDFQNEVDAPVYASFPGGVPVSSLHYEAYVDLCTPTDFRLALTMHRTKP